MEASTMKPSTFDGEYTAIRACYYSDGNFMHKYFSVGEELPEGWIPDANGCTHFALAHDAKKIIKSGSAVRRASTAGDDKRSTKDMILALDMLRKTKTPSSWRRKKIWGELNRLESAVAKDAQTNPKKEK